MLVSDILSRKRYLDKKLLDLDNYLDSISSLEIKDKVTILNKALDEKFKLVNKIRSHVILIESLNQDTVVEIGDDQIAVSEAVRLRDSFEEQLRTLDKLIRKGDFKVMNVFSLIDQRDSIFEEYIKLDRVITHSDCTTHWESDE